MGIRTDLTSLGAIGLGTAVAVVGTGALLLAGSLHDADATFCVDAPSVATVAAMPAVPAAPSAPAAPAVVADFSVDAAPAAPLEVTELADAREAPDAAKAHRVSVVVSNRIEMRTECIAEFEERLVDVRVRALEQAEVAPGRAADVRVLADEIRAEVEAIRADAGANREVDPERIQALVEAALAEAGIRRGGSWGN